jgi:hypothetical protein
MKSDPPYQLACLRLPGFDPGSWESVGDAFRDAPACRLQQAWLSDKEPGFRPGRVRTGWTDEALIVFAELDDDDIFNPATELNEHFYKHGDVFEMFLRPTGRDAYYEFHVGPQNQKFQMRIPSAADFAALRGVAGIPPAWMISQRQIESRVEVSPEAGQWKVLAAIPFDMVAEVQRPQAGARWMFSFCRYDYSRPNPRPVLSSTSPHHQPVSYHSQAEWGMLTFFS